MALADAAFGVNSAIQQQLLRRMQEAQVAHKMNMDERTQNRADQELSEQVKYRELQAQMRADQLAREGQEHTVNQANTLADQIPAGTFYQDGDPAVSTMQRGLRGALLKPTEATVPMGGDFTGPMPTGETPEQAQVGRPKGFIKTASAKQLDTEFDNQRQAAADAERSSYQTGMLGLRGELNDIRATQAENAQNNRGKLSATEEIRQTRNLRNDYVRETKSARTVVGQLALMRSSMDAVRAGSTTAGSQGVLVTFQKILDPESVVRESEYARSASGLSLLARMEGQWQKITAGGAGVPPQELEQFLKLAEQFAKNQTTFATQTRRQIDGIASKYGLDPSLITRDLDPEEDGAGATNGPATTTSPAASGGPSYQDYLESRKAKP